MNTTTKATTKVRVRVGSTVREYPRDIAGYGDHLAAGGTVVSLPRARAEGAELIRRNDWVTTASYWVALDESGLVYRIEVAKSGSYKIMAASPTREIRDLYNAAGNYGTSG